MKRRYLCMHTYPPEVLKEITPNCWRAPNFWICLEGINTQFLKFLPSQFPKKNHPNFKACSGNWYQTLRFLSSILKKHSSLQALRDKNPRVFRPNVSDVQRDVRPNDSSVQPSGRGGNRLAWSISSMAPRMRCLSQVMQCPAKLWPQVVERGREIFPDSKNLDPVFSSRTFSRKWFKSTKRPRLPIVVTFGWFESL